MAKMICLTPLRYAGKLLTPGMEFDVREQRHIQLLTVLRKAKTIEADDAAIEVLNEVKPRRRYKRRDMQAEDA